MMNFVARQPLFQIAPQAPPANASTWAMRRQLALQPQPGARKQPLGFGGVATQQNIQQGQQFYAK